VKPLPLWDGILTKIIETNKKRWAEPLKNLPFSYSFDDFMERYGF
jgi:hypothetical protein